MYCVNCGKELEEGALFCDKCGKPINGTVKEKTPDSKKKKSNKGILIVALLLIFCVVIIITVGTVGIFLSKMGIINTNSITLTGENVAQDNYSDSNNGNNESNYQDVIDFATNYGGEWKVKQYFDSDDNKWHLYDLGKKMFIVAHNFLNDYSYTTGGYEQKVAEAKLIDTTTGQVVASASKYEYVPMEVHGVHGQDIEYSCPTVVITTELVDLSGMGGPIMSLADFRVEKINGKKYLINDNGNFAFYYDGDYLEYCEPDAYGYYQGYYAYDKTDSLVNVTAIYDSYQSY